MKISLAMFITNHGSVLILIVMEDTHEESRRISP